MPVIALPLILSGGVSALVEMQPDGVAVDGYSREATRHPHAERGPSVSDRSALVGAHELTTLVSGAT